MVITWNGYGRLEIVSKPVMGEVTLVTNPFGDALGKVKSSAASLVIQSHEGLDTAGFKGIEPEHPEDGRKVFLINHAGEYEVQGVSVNGGMVKLKSGEAHTVYRIDTEGIKLGFLGALDRHLTEPELEKLGAVDILFCPAGGGKVLTAEQAAAVIMEIEPRIVVPIYVDGEGFGSADVLGRALGIVPERVTKFKIQKSGLPLEDLQLVILEKS